MFHLHPSFTAISAAWHFQGIKPGYFPDVVRVSSSQLGFYSAFLLIFFINSSSGKMLGRERLPLTGNNSQITSSFIGLSLLRFNMLILFANQQAKYAWQHTCTTFSAMHKPPLKPTVSQLPGLWQGGDKGKHLSQDAPRTKNQRLEMNKWLLSANKKPTKQQ